MPWKETCAVEERMKFMVEYVEAELSMSELCRRFGVSRKTGYKWVERFERDGPAGLEDGSRAPKNHPNAVRERVIELILEARAGRPTWGPKKLKVWLARRDPRLRWPSESAIGEILKRHGLTSPRRRKRRATPYGQPFAEVVGPNQVWCADFKGWFRTGDGQRCEPLTISDAFSRFLLRCQILKSTDRPRVQSVFEACFREYGVPAVIRTDNGSPFASTGLGGLSSLSVWLIKLGLTPERIPPGQPQQNGRHERMHLTLKKETASPPQANLRKQQAAFDAFRAVYNEERPHQALEMRTPASLYEPSARAFPGRLAPLAYPERMITRVVHKHGQMTWQNERVFIGEAFAGEPLGLDQLDAENYAIYIGQVPLGFFNSRRLKVTGLNGGRK